MKSAVPLKQLIALIFFMCLWGQVAGMSSQKRSAKQAKVILERMVDEAVQILNNMRTQYIGA